VGFHSSTFTRELSIWLFGFVNILIHFPAYTRKGRILGGLLRMRTATKEELINRDEVAGEWRKLHEEYVICTLHLVAIE
jgi:hypothetical protein